MRQVGVLVPGNYLEIPWYHQSVSIVNEPLVNWNTNLSLNTN